MKYQLIVKKIKDTKQIDLPFFLDPTILLPATTKTSAESKATQLDLCDHTGSASNHQKIYILMLKY